MISHFLFKSYLFGERIKSGRNLSDLRVSDDCRFLFIDKLQQGCYRPEQKISVYCAAQHAGGQEKVLHPFWTIEGLVT
jgi:hypothetical protein